MTQLRNALIALGLLSNLGCSTPTLRERYENLDGDAKAFFLTYYPILTPNQRSAFIDHMEDAASFIETWSEDAEFKRKLENFPPTKRRYAPSRIEIAPALEMITEGSPVPLKAWIYYPDQRKVDATADVEWSVQPSSLAKIDQSVLEIGCLASDISVTANFLDEHQGSRTYQFRKPLRALEVGIEDSWKSLNQNSTVLKLKVTASCEDGTRTQVSCQADWKIPPTEGLEMRGCGNLYFTSPDRRSGELIKVSASYGGKETSFALRLP